MQVSEQENRGSREGKNRTRVADNKRKMMVTFAGNKSPHPGGWTAFCKSPECTGYAQFRCPDCKQPTCTGCAREWYDMETQEERIICGNCWEAL